MLGLCQTALKDILRLNLPGKAARYLLTQVLETFTETRQALCSGQWRTTASLDEPSLLCQFRSFNFLEGTLVVGFEKS